MSLSAPWTRRPSTSPRPTMGQWPERIWTSSYAASPWHWPRRIDLPQRVHNLCSVQEQILEPRSFGRAELGEQLEGLLPVTAGLLVVASDATRLAEAAVRAGLLVLVTGLGGQAERVGIFGPGVLRLAGGEHHLA